MTEPIQAETIRKYSNQTIPQLIKRAEKVFNAFIRKRDTVDGMVICISCSKPHSAKGIHAGHYVISVRLQECIFSSSKAQKVIGLISKILHHFPLIYK